MEKKKFVLTIDTTCFEETRVGLKNPAGKVVEKKKFAAGRKLSEKLLPEIDKLLKRSNLGPQDLAKIKVNPGSGSFTGTRIGVAVANALGFALGIPVNDKTMVEPIYGEPPHITLK